MRTIDFPGEKSYPVVVGDGLIEDVVSKISKYENIAIFAATPMSPIAARISEQLDSSVKTSVHLLPDGEQCKTIIEAAKAWDFLAQHRISRTDLVVGIGGGAVTDLVNFVAATWLRGVDVVLMPTTVLAMVDAAIGGKCGINTDRGKNLVGVFNDPLAVYCDVELLSTLDTFDLRAGFAEIAKCGFIADPIITENILTSEVDLFDLDSEVFLDCIYRAIAVKANVVAADPYERSEFGVGRAALNYGHTLGHAIEKFSGFRWRHGDAVSVGMVFAAELANQLGMLSVAEVDVHRSVLSKLKLPVTYAGASLADLTPIMNLDKKAQGTNLRFVLLRRLTEPEFVVNPSSDSLATAFTKLLED